MLMVSMWFFYKHNSTGLWCWCFFQLNICFRFIPKNCVHEHKSPLPSVYQQDIVCTQVHESVCVCVRVCNSRRLVFLIVQLVIFVYLCAHLHYRYDMCVVVCGSHLQFLVLTLVNVWRRPLKFLFASTFNSILILKMMIICKEHTE